MVSNALTYKSVPGYISYDTQLNIFILARLSRYKKGLFRLKTKLTIQ